MSALAMAQPAAASTARERDDAQREPANRVQAAIIACERLDDEVFAEIRRRTIFECGKWDPQAGDVSALSNQVLTISHETWTHLAGAAEAMSREMLAAEREILARPDLWRVLGLDRAIRSGLTRARRALESGANGEADHDAVRQARFDFHLTRDGWRISEVNSDVPGGYVEASGFTRLVAEHAAPRRGRGMAGDPSQALARALLSRVRAERSPAIALVHATAYTDDRQVMISLARALECAGARPVLAAPDAIDWRGEQPRALVREGDVALGGLIRFFPGEWLPNLPRRTGWRRLFGDPRLCMSNPATALITQSKRFPLVWDSLRTQLPAWLANLPETRHPHRTLRGSREEWVLKPALGRVGEAIDLAGVTAQKDSRRIQRWARRRPSQWIAQRRFEAAAVESSDGPLYPCLGVFVIAGKACGIYGRAAPRPLIDQHASDIAVLVQHSGKEDGCLSV